MERFALNSLSLYMDFKETIEQNEYSKKSNSLLFLAKVDSSKRQALVTLRI